MRTSRSVVDTSIAVLCGIKFPLWVQINPVRFVNVRQYEKKKDMGEK